jgi:hypothetical protein
MQARDLMASKMHTVRLLRREDIKQLTQVKFSNPSEIVCTCDYKVPCPELPRCARCAIARYHNDVGYIHAII